LLSLAQTLRLPQAERENRTDALAAASLAASVGAIRGAKRPSNRPENRRTPAGQTRSVLPVHDWSDRGGTPIIRDELAAVGSARTLSGFTLLEVMMAVAILGLLLTAILTSEAGALKMAHRSRKTELAAPLVRCKMGEIEEQMAKEGFPALYASGSDQCCKEAELEGFTCDWTVNRIVLPETMFMSGEDDPKAQAEQAKRSAKDSLGLPLEQNPALPSDKSGSPFGANQSVDPNQNLGVNQLFGANQNLGSNQSDISQLLLGGGGGVSDILANVAMPFVYLTFKPFIEDQIRRASVTVKWREGEKEHSFEVVQYLVIEQPPLLPDTTDTTSTSTTDTGTSLFNSLGGKKIGN